MDIQVGEVHADLKLTDPRVLEALARAVKEQLEREREQEKRAGAERSLKSSVTGRR